MGLVIQSIKDFRHAWRMYLAFGLVYLLMGSYIYVPMLAYVFNRILLRSGPNVWVNAQVFRVLLNYRSGLGFVVIIILAVIFLMVELGALILMAHKQYANKRVHVSEAILTGIYRMRRMVPFGCVYLVTIFLLIMPWVQLPIRPVVLRQVTLPELLLERISGSLWIFIPYMVILIGLIIIGFRWIFTLHGIMLKNQKIKTAISDSQFLTKKIRNLHLIQLAVLNVFFLVIIAGGITLVMRGIYALGIPVNYQVRQGMVTLSSFMLFIYTLMIMPINAIFITRLYYRACDKAQWTQLPKPKTIYIKKLVALEIWIKGWIRGRRFVSGMLLISLLWLVFATNVNVNESFMHVGRDVRIAAHRAGYVNTPENSLSAIQYALEMGADVIELDVQLTKDYELVVFHDVGLQRMAGVNKRIRDLTYKEILAYEIGSSVSPSFYGEGIPRLEDALALIEAKAIVLIDVKAYGDRSVLAEKIIEAASNTNMLPYIMVQSFDYAFLKELREQNATIPLGQIMYYAIGNLSALDVDFYTVHKGMLTQSLVEKARADERQIWVWTLNEEAQLRDALMYDIDGMITNDVALAQSVLGVEPINQGLLGEGTQ